MRKILLLMSIMMLTGCSQLRMNQGEANQTNMDSSAPTREENGSPRSDGFGIDDITDEDGGSSNVRKGKGSASSASLFSDETVDSAKAELIFTPQLGETSQGMTTENDEILASLQKLVDENPRMGIEEDVTVAYTGYAFGQTPNYSGIFLIINRTSTAMKNIYFTYTFGGVDRHLVFDEESFFLEEEWFGVLEPNTAMPMYLTVSQDQQVALTDLDLNLLIEEVHVMEYEEMENQQTNSEIEIQMTGEKNSSIAKEERSKEGLAFIIPQQNVDNGQTVENNPLLADLESIVKNRQDMGLEEELSIVYSGLFDDTEKGMAAFFFVVNKTNSYLEEMEFSFTYGNSEGEMVWTNKRLLMKKDVFGTMEPNSVLPLTLYVPEGKEDLFRSISEENGLLRLDNLSFSSPGSYSRVSR